MNRFHKNSSAPFSLRNKIALIYGEKGQEQLGAPAMGINKIQNKYSKFPSGYFYAPFFILDFADKTIIRNLIMEYHQRENVSSVVPWFITERNQIFVIHGLLFPKELHSIDQFPLQPVSIADITSVPKERAWFFSIPPQAIRKIRFSHRRKIELLL